MFLVSVEGKINMNWKYGGRGKKGIFQAEQKGNVAVKKYCAGVTKKGKP